MNRTCVMLSIDYIIYTKYINKYIVYQSVRIEIISTTVCSYIISINHNNVLYMGRLAKILISI